MFLKVQDFFRPLWIRLIVVLLVTAGFSSLANNAYRAFVWQGNINQLNELNRRALFRVETTADFVLDTLRNMQLSGLSRCSDFALNKINRISFSTGAIKDIQVLDGNMELLCAGTPFRQFSDAGDISFENVYPSSQEHIYFYDIGRYGSGLMGLGRRMSEDKYFIAILNLNSLLFDVFPEQLRSAARVDLILGEDGVQVASRVPSALKGVRRGDFDVFSGSSEHFPLEVRFSVDRAAISAWNMEDAGFIGELSVVAGLVLGWMALVFLGRPVTLERRMRTALRNGEFVPFMQPIFNIGSRAIVGCEVLVRWVKPNGEIVPPSEFIPVAEGSGLVIPMTRMLIRDTLEKLGDHLHGDKNFKVAFNIVPADLISDDFEKDLCQIVKRAGVARRQIVLEITERQGFADQEQAATRISALRELGFRIALDDTGAGHNGLSNVQRLGADIIKIDKIFVDRVGADSSATTIVQMLVRLARELNMSTVAEGIETEEQLQALAACGVDEGQGYLVSPPVDFAEFAYLVRSRPLLLRKRIAAA